MSYLKKCEELLKTYLLSKGIESANAYKHQRETWNAIYRYDHDANKALLLKAPTASGKTESILIPYIYQIIEDDWFLAPSLIYVFPNKTLLYSQYK